MVSDSLLFVYYGSRFYIETDRIAALKIYSFILYSQCVAWTRAWYASRVVQKRSIRAAAVSIQCTNDACSNGSFTRNTIPQKSVTILTTARIITTAPLVFYVNGHALMCSVWTSSSTLSSAVTICPHIMCSSFSPCALHSASLCSRFGCPSSPGSKVTSHIM